jgi:hypothetical protein
LKLRRKWDKEIELLPKQLRNTVPVPRHWCFKRKYLQGKRGIEKPPFDLPDFIKVSISVITVFSVTIRIREIFGTYPDPWIRTSDNGTSSESCSFLQ